MHLEGRNNIRLCSDPNDNLLEFEGTYYQIDFLQKKNFYVHGGNGIVFSLKDEQRGEEYAIKFLKYPTEDGGDANWKIEKRIRRFEREIEALSIAKENGLTNVIDLEFYGWLEIDGLTFLYYVMQKCERTLNAYLADVGGDLGIIQKTLLCQKILEGFQGLHEYFIFHRDIKHDNIYFIGNEPYIGDLGLAKYPTTKYEINERGDLIGPTGWFSPEALNKYLVEKSPNVNNFDCEIDSKSEVFQLGKLFWYIFQGNLPIGQITIEDFIPRNESIYAILYKMLLYSKVNRSSIQTAASEIETFLYEN